MEKKKLKKLLKRISISFLPLIFIIVFMSIFVYLSSEPSKPFHSKFWERIGVFFYHIQDFEEINKRYPKNTKEIISYLDSKGGTAIHAYKDLFGSGEITIFDLPKPPDSGDKYFKVDIKVKPMYIGYYVNKELTAFAIYGVGKGNKIFRDKDGKIFYVSRP